MVQWKAVCAYTDVVGVNCMLVNLSWELTPSKAALIDRD